MLVIAVDCILFTTDKRAFSSLQGKAVSLDFFLLLISPLSVLRELPLAGIQYFDALLRGLNVNTNSQSIQSIRSRLLTFPHLLLLLTERAMEFVPLQVLIWGKLYAQLPLSLCGSELLASVLILFYKGDRWQMTDRQVDRQAATYIKALVTLAFIYKEPFSCSLTISLRQFWLLK